MCVRKWRPGPQATLARGPKCTRARSPNMTPPPCGGSSFVLLTVPCAGCSCEQGVTAAVNSKMCYPNLHLVIIKLESH